LIKHHVIVYYDDPDTLQRDEDARLVYGFVVEEGMNEEEIKTAGFDVKVTKELLTLSG
jgi:hypothetical protein